METKLIKAAKEYLDNICRIRDVQTEMFNEVKDCYGISMQRKSGSSRNYYYAKKADELSYKYLGKENSEAVNRIKEYRYLSSSLDAINNNVESVNNMIALIKETDYQSVNDVLPQVYRDATLPNMFTQNAKAIEWKERAEVLKSRCSVYKPEELVNKTNDGELVRSKSEAMIYNYLLSMGITFSYELPLRLRTGTVYPDFTILSEHDYETEIILEHQGMMNNEGYRNRFFDKLHKYLQDGYVPGIDVFFTFDYYNGGFDNTPVEDLVRNKIKS